jgi:putative nucleotidyltransferase with HDIG domain
MRKLLLKLKRAIKRIFKVKEDIDLNAARRRSRRLVKYLMGLVAVLLITLLYPPGDLRGPLDVPREGEIAPQTIIADFSFSILKNKSDIEEERDLAILSTPLYIDFNDDIAQASRNELQKFFNRYRGMPEPDSAAAYDEFLRKLKSDYPAIPVNSLSRMAQTDSRARLASILDTILADDIYYFGVLGDLGSLPSDEFNSIIMKKEKRDLLMVRNQLIGLQGANTKLVESLSRVENLSDGEVELAYEIGRRFIRPNAAYNDIVTNAARDSAIAEISNVDQEVSEGYLIIHQGNIVDGVKARLLVAYAQEIQKQAAAQGWFYSILPLLSRFVLVGAIIVLMLLFFYHFRPDVYWSNNKLFAILIIIGLELFLVNLIGVRLTQSVYLYPIAILSILITVLFDARLGVVVTLLVAILLGVLNRFNFTITLITTIAGTVACFSAGEVRRRSEFYRIIIFLSLTYVVIAFVVESLKLSPVGEVLTYCGYGLINGFVAPLLTIGLLPMFESLFGFSTNITLLELADLNQPLLKRLAMEAPGTYHHSIIVGNLAESAAKAIDANPLLARVGSYYHDIGKMEIPEYFVENQLGIKSKHESLNPTMSALVLASHVKKGRIIGEEAGLPDAVLNFVEEHHGTTMMSYFYNKAKEMELPIKSEDEFRYPGPKPQSKETAIVMLADSTEAASRTLDNPTPARIRNLIQKLINDKFSSGELTNCHLTLRDLNDIREAFVSILIGVFHHRIPYPKKEEEEPA